MTEKVKHILEIKPSKDELYNSVYLPDDYLEKQSNKMIELEKKQESENEKLKPGNELLNMRFDI